MCFYIAFHLALDGGALDASHVHRVGHVELHDCQRSQTISLLVCRQGARSFSLSKQKQHSMSLKR